MLLVAGKEGRTDILQFTTGVSELAHLDDLPARTIEISFDLIKALAPETLAIPDLRDRRLVKFFTTLYRGRRLLSEDVPDRGWSIAWGRELNISDDARHFGVHEDGVPLREGKHIHQFVHDFAPPTYRLHPEGLTYLTIKEAKHAGYRAKDVVHLDRGRGEKRFNETGKRQRVLEVPMDQYRLVFREVARATDERTMIAAILPPGHAVAHSLHYLRRSKCEDRQVGYRTVLTTRFMIFALAVLNSLVVDFVVRRKVVAHLTHSVVDTVPFPDSDVDSPHFLRIVEVAGRLTCRHREFEELADVLQVTCGALTPAEERQLRAELDALVAHLYELNGDDLELVLADFRQSASAEGAPVRPDDQYKNLVREHFARLVVQ